MSSTALHLGTDSAPSRLLHLPEEVLLVVLNRLDARSLRCLAATCTDIQPHVEEVLSQRAAAHGYVSSVHLSGNVGRDGAAQFPRNFSVLARLAWFECERRRDAAWAPVAAGAIGSFIVADGGRLMSCGAEIADGDAPCPGVLGQGDLPLDCSVILTPTPLPPMVGVHINRVSSRGYFTVAVSRTGSVYTWGIGGNGCLGHGNAADMHIPKRVQALAGHRVLNVAAGEGHCLAATEGGDVFSWGGDQHGQCGHGRTDGRYMQRTPRHVHALGGVHVRNVSAGFSHSLVVTEEGTLYAFGEGNNGRLGHGHLGSEHYPKVVDALRHERITAAAAGGEHSLALTEDGSVFAWGDNEFGQLGTGHTQRPLGAWAELSGTYQLMDWLPQRIHAFEWRDQQIYCANAVCSIVAGHHRSFALTAGGQLWEWGQCTRGNVLVNRTPIRVEELRHEMVVALATNDYHTIAVSCSGRVFGSGHTYYLGLNARNADAADGDGGEAHSRWYPYNREYDVKRTYCDDPNPSATWRTRLSGTMYVWYYGLIGMAWSGVLWYAAGAG